MTERRALIARFLDDHGFNAVVRVPLAGDASFRRYERLEGGPRPAVLMDAPPEQNDVRPFLRVGEHLRQSGYSAPEVIAADAVAGLVLLEDLGDRSFNRAIGAGADERVLYTAAIDLLVELQRQPALADLPAYDDAKFLAEAALLVEWYAPGLDEAAAAQYGEIWRELLPLARAGPDRFVYVDYHADNLFWLPERAGIARVGLLDFQDARLGPPAYDLVSLLEDARRDLEPGLPHAMIERYLRLRPELDRHAFEAGYALLGAQRNAKILGLFSRLALRDGKKYYLNLQNRVLNHLLRDVAHPALAPLADWFRRHLPV